MEEKSWSERTSYFGIILLRLYGGLTRPTISLQRFLNGRQVRLLTARQISSGSKPIREFILMCSAIVFARSLRIEEEYGLEKLKAAMRGGPFLFEIIEEALRMGNQ